METGDRRTEDGGGLTRNEENVIRLPREWLGPPEELVPVGPAARARAAQRELDAATPPAADAFWSEDSAALHDAVQAPPDPSPEQLEPPVGLVAPLAGRRMPTLRRLATFRLGLGMGRVPRWSAVVAVPIVALVVMAAIGAHQGPASHPAAPQDSASRSGTAAHQGAAGHGNTPARHASLSKTALGGSATHRMPTRTASRQHPTVGSRARARTRANGSARHSTRTRQKSRPQTSSPSPAPTVTEAAASPPSSDSSASSPSTSAASTAPSGSSAATESTASSAQAEGSNRASGPAGPTGIGSITDGCNPKCS